MSGINLQIVNGLGSTGTINGLYKTQLNCENGGASWGNSHKTGSHYLVLGTQNNYSRYGGIVAGLRNTVNRGYGSVNGGAENMASGFYSSINGGIQNSASSYYSSVTGGYGNSASGFYSSVSGGLNRESVNSYDWRAGSLFENQ